MLQYFLLLFGAVYSSGVEDIDDILGCIYDADVNIYSSKNPENNIILVKKNLMMLTKTLTCLNSINKTAAFGSYRNPSIIITNEMINLPEYKKIAAKCSSQFRFRTKILITNKIIMQIVRHFFTITLIGLIYFRKLRVLYQKKDQDAEVSFSALDVNNVFITPIHKCFSTISRQFIFKAAEKTRKLQTVTQFMYNTNNEQIASRILMVPYKGKILIMLYSFKCLDTDFIPMEDFCNVQIETDDLMQRITSKISLNEFEGKPAFDLQTNFVSLHLEKSRQICTQLSHSMRTFEVVFYILLADLLKLPVSKDAYRQFFVRLHEALNLDSYGFYAIEGGECYRIAGIFREDEDEQRMIEILSESPTTPAGTASFTTNRWGCRVKCYKYQFGRVTYMACVFINAELYMVNYLEAPFDFLTTAFITRYHLNIAACEEDRTMDRINDLLTKTGGIALFDCQAPAEARGSNFDGAALSKPDISVGKVFGDKTDETKLLQSAFASIPRAKTDPVVTALDDGRFVRIVCAPMLDPLQGVWARTMLVEDISASRTNDDQLMSVNSDLKLVSQYLGLHRLVSECQLADDSLSKELGYQVPITDLTEMIYPDDMHVLKMLSPDKTITFRLKDSKEMPMWYTAICAETPHTFAGFVYSVNDITTLKSIADDALDNTLLNSIPDLFAIWSVEPHSGRILCSLAKTYKPVESFNDIVALCQEDQQNVFREWFGKMNNQVQQSRTFRMKLSTEEFQWYDVIFNLSSPSSALIVALNIEEAKATQDALRDIQEHVDLALYNANVVQWKFYDETEPEKIFTCGPLTFEPLELNWTSIAHNISIDFQDATIKAFKNCLETGQPVDIEIPIMFDSVVWVAVRGFRSKFNGMISGVYFDMTELMSLQMDVERQKQRAIEASKAKSMFLANMSHEIRTPLHGMFSILELLMLSNLNENQKILLGCIQSSFDRLLELLNDTLDLAKIEQGKMPVSFVRFSPTEELETIFKKFWKGKSATQDLGIIIPPEFPTYFMGDPFIFTRVARNLASNAMKFTEKGKITLSLCTNYEDFMDRLILRVSDTGVGISDTVQSTIFETFTQIDGSISRPYGGSGVGLTVVKRFVELANGTIEVVSMVGRGSTFTATFPFNALYVPYLPRPIRNKKRQMFVRGNVVSQEMLASYARHYGLEYVTNSRRVDNSLVLILFFNNENTSDSEMKDVIDVHSKHPNSAFVVLRSDLIKGDDGVTDTIMLPVLPSRVRSRVIAGKMSKAVNLSSNDSSVNARVLIADDNPTNQIVMQKILEKLGCSYACVGDGQSVLNILKCNDFDVILMDINMPILNGPDTTRAIRASPDHYRNIPIIAMTASTAKEDEDRCLNSGMTAFVSKPVSIAKLASVIKAHIK